MNYTWKSPFRPLTFEEVISCWVDDGWTKARAVRELIAARMRGCNGFTTGHGNAAKRRLELLKSQFELRADEASAEETKDHDRQP